MFDKLFNRNKDEKAPENEEQEMRKAVAALFVEAARADDDYTDKERAIIDKALAAIFELPAADATTLRSAGEAAQDGALDIQRFTRTAKEMSTAEKITFVERLWEIVLSDGDRDPFEDTLIRRICGLIYLDDKESGAARARVAARMG